MTVQQPEPHSGAGKPPKPMGISVLSWLLLLGGIWSLALWLWWPPLLTLRASIVAIGVPSVFLWGGLVLLGALVISSGVGLMRGRTWGWWIASFLFMYAAASSLNGLLFSGTFLSSPLLAAEEANRPLYYLSKRLFRLAVSGWAYGYLLKVHVRAYFGLEHVSLRRVIAIPGCICILLLVMMAFGNIQAL